MINLITADRLLNAVLSLLCLVFLVRSLRGWKKRSPGNRFYWSGVAIMIGVVGYGSFDAIRQQITADARVAGRSIFATIALVYLLFGLISLRGERQHWEPDEPQPPAKVDAHTDR